MSGSLRRRLQLTPRQWLIVAHDLFATVAALFVTCLVRFEDYQFSVRFDWLVMILPFLVAYAAIVYFLFRLHEAKWRFTSMPELLRAVQAAAVVAVSLLIYDYILLSPQLFDRFLFGRITIALYFVLLTVFLIGPRVAYRYLRDVKTRRQNREGNALPILILGRAADAEVPLRAFESGAITRLWPAGILSPSPADRAVTLRGVPVLGGFDDLPQVVSMLRAQGTEIGRLVLTPSALAQEAQPEQLLATARRLNIPVSRLPSLDAREAPSLQPVAVDDLLLRPSVTIDYQMLESFIRGKAVLVTGGGGSIGSEICDRVAAFGAARLLILENSEAALYAITESLAGKRGTTAVEGRIADIRDRDRVFELTKAFAPDIVFHAAALKHVPFLEQNCEEGVKTNVFGSVNVVDAALAAGVQAVVMISTDKAIEPVSILGATKRVAEMYCQALDAARAANPAAGGTRIISVRFGNVLGSNGSVVPKFKRQIEAGGPVTVTDANMVRYFMTIREACDLVVTAAAHAMRAGRDDVAIYVLNMGQPVRILDLAERLIRLSGLEPHRDIEIAFTGVRPGERLHEILFAHDETSRDIAIDGIVAAEPSYPALDALTAVLATLQRQLESGDAAGIEQTLRDVVPDYRPMRLS